MLIIKQGGLWLERLLSPFRVLERIEYRAPWRRCDGRPAEPVRDEALLLDAALG